MEFTPTTLILLGVAAGLVVISLIIGFLAFRQWRFKANLLEGYTNYDMNRVQSAKPALEAVLSWKKDHPGARELLAKICCDQGRLDDAERHYRELISQGHDRANVRAGLGVVYLKKANKVESAADVTKLVAQARTEYSAAKILSAAVPEADIGLGHCELLLSHKLKEPARIAAARQTFEKVRNDLLKDEVLRSAITRDGLVDYYSGLGKVLASGDAGGIKEALTAFKSCYQYARRWPVPMSNMLLVEARRFAETEFTSDGLMNLKNEALAFRKEMGDAWKSNKDAYGSLKEPWLTFSLAVAGAFLKTGNLKEYDNIAYDLPRDANFGQSLKPRLFEASNRVELASNEDVAAGVQNGHVTKAEAALCILIEAPALSEESGREMKALALNNSAWMQAWLGAYTVNASPYKKAEASLLEALKIAPNDYTYNRNMVVVLRRQKKDPQKYLEAAKAAATTDILKQDYENLEKFVAGK